MWGLGWPFAVLWSVAVLMSRWAFASSATISPASAMHWKTVRKDAARERLRTGSRWMWRLPRSEIVRHVIEYSVHLGHRHVFGVLAWFSILAALGLGPTGAVLYRMAEFVSRYWHSQTATSALSHGANPADRPRRSRPGG